jgi:hypothetical protein
MKIKNEYLYFFDFFNMAGKLKEKVKPIFYAKTQGIAKYTLINETYFDAMIYEKIIAIPVYTENNK